MPRIPNIVVMLADDLGFGDLGCYGGAGVPTPNLDRLAGAGLRFTNAYATAATCTPSRYSLLTGSYPWRNRQAAILPGDAGMIITDGTATLPALLKRAGYATGVVGKWHLGLGDGRSPIDWNRPIPRTPLDVGFDFSFIFPATNDRVPCVYLAGRSVANLDPADPIEVCYDADKPFPGELTGRDHPELLRVKHSHGHDMTIVNGVGRIGHMRGGRAALWTDETMAETFLAQATNFVSEHRDQPFFLYYALHQPHVPRLPGPRFAGTTKLGPRGDVIAEMDWCVGQLLARLDELGLADDTIVIFTSDNGPVLDDGYVDRARELCGEHRPAGPLRGGKYSLFDGGARVPAILRWPGQAAPGESPALFSQVDFLASFAALAGVALPPDAGLDSLNMLQALIGRDRVGRSELVTEGMQGQTVLRQGDRVYIAPYGGAAFHANTGTELGRSIWPQLYDLSADIGQRRNLADENPRQVATMADRLKDIMAGGRTRA